MLVFIDSTWGTPRSTNLWVASSKPSTFSRMTPFWNKRSPTSRLASAGFVSNTNSGSLGLLACRLLTNRGSIVVLLLAGWQVPQVRPFPLKVSVKKMSAPAHTCWVASPVTTRGSCAHAASRSAAVRARACVWTASPGAGPGAPSHAASVAAAAIEANTGRPTFANDMGSPLSRSPRRRGHRARVGRKRRAVETAPSVRGGGPARGSTDHTGGGGPRSACGAPVHCGRARHVSQRTVFARGGATLLRDVGRRAVQRFPARARSRSGCRWRR